MAGLQFLAAMAETGRRASELTRQFETVPQMLKNVKFRAGQTPLEVENVRKVIAAAEVQMAGKGRILIRKSGTEPLIRVMAESEDAGLLSETVDSIVAAVEAATA
jgi:phosphoglucosamine mutase